MKMMDAGIGSLRGAVRVEGGKPCVTFNPNPKSQTPNLNLTLNPNPKPQTLNPKTPKPQTPNHRSNQGRGARGALCVRVAGQLELRSSRKYCQLFLEPGRP